MYRIMTAQLRFMRFNLGTNSCISESSAVRVLTSMATLCVRRRKITLLFGTLENIQGEHVGLDCFYLQTFPPRTATRSVFMTSYGMAIFSHK